MKGIERLARRICWLEFGTPKPKGTTEAKYWKGVHHDKKIEYMEEARRLMFITRELDRSRDGWEILGEALERVER